MKIIHFSIATTNVTCLINLGFRKNFEIFENKDFLLDSKIKLELFRN